MKNVKRLSFKTKERRAFQSSLGFYQPSFQSFDPKLLFLLFILFFVPQLQAMGNSNDVTKCTTSASQTDSKEKRFQSLTKIYSKIKKNKVSPKDFIFISFMGSLNRFQQDYVSDYPNLLHLMREIEKARSEIGSEAEVQSTQRTETQRVKKLLDPELRKSAESEKIFWETPNSDWQIKSSYPIESAKFKSFYLHYRGKKISIDASIFKEKIEYIEYPNALFLKKTSYSPAKLYYLENSKIRSKKISDLLMYSSDSVYNLVGETYGMHVEKILFSSEGLKTESELLIRTNQGYPKTNISFGNSVVLTFKEPQPFDSPIEANLTSHRKLYILDFHENAYKLRDIEEIPIDLESSANKDGLYFYRNTDTQEVSIIHEHDQYANVSKIDLSRLSDSSIDVSLLKIKKMANDYISITYPAKTQAMFIYKFNGKNSFEYIKEYQDMEVMQATEKEIYWLNSKTQEWFKVFPGKDFTIVKQNISKYWYQLSPGIYSRTHGNKIELARNDENNVLSKFFEVEVPVDSNGVNEWGFFAEQRYLVLQFQFGDYAILDTKAQKLEWKSLNTQHISNYKYIKGVDSSYLVLYTALRSSPVILSIENDSIQKILSVESEPEISLILGDHMNSRSIYVSDDKLHLGDSYHLKIHDMKNW